MTEKKIKFRGTVIAGDGIAGVDYDFPTANLRFIKEPNIDTGVYAALTKYKGNEFESVVCYGVGNPVKFEVHLFELNDELLGKELEVELLYKVSELIPWQSKERMRQKIFHDVELVHDYLNTRKKKA